MKTNSKKFTHVIRSIEDAVGFDEETEVERYEKFNNKKPKKTDIDESISAKKPSKLRDNRRSNFDDQTEW